MPFWQIWPEPDLSQASETWRLRARTAEAMVLLVAARLAIQLVKLERWRGQLGLAGNPADADVAEARRLARHVDRAAGRLPLETRCLPRAITLSRMLCRRKISHRLVIAARRAEARSGADDLHAWVELGEAIVLGDLPGEWLPLLILP